MSDRILNLPPLSSVADPATRTVLQSIYQYLQVRDGQVRDGKNKFLTDADVGTSIYNFFTGGSTYTSVTYPPGASPGGTVQPVIDGIVREILNDPGLLELQQKIELMQTPTWLLGAMNSATSNQVSRISSIAAKAGENEAALGREEQARVTLERAAVEALKALIASFGRSTASITTLEQATATMSSATATLKTQLTTEIVNSYLSTEEGWDLQQTVDYLQAIRYYKVETDGRFAGGYSFSVTGTPQQVTSSFIIAADKFAVVGTGGNSVVPFAVYTNSWVDSQGIVHSPGTYIQNAKIAQATIDNLTVTTSLIAPSAVTETKIGAGAVTRTATATSSTAFTSTPQTLPASRCAETLSGWNTYVSTTSSWVAGDVVRISFSSANYSTGHTSSVFIAVTAGATKYAIVESVADYDLGALVDNSTVHTAVCQPGVIPICGGSFELDDSSTGHHNTYGVVEFIATSTFSGTVALYAADEGGGTVSPTRNLIVTVTKK